MPDSDALVERAARAAWELDKSRGPSDAVTWETFGEFGKDTWRAIVRAVLAVAGTGTPAPTDEDLKWAFIMGVQGGSNGITRPGEDIMPHAEKWLAERKKRAAASSGAPAAPPERHRENDVDALCRCGHRATNHSGGHGVCRERRSALMPCTCTWYVAAEPDMTEAVPDAETPSVLQAAADVGVGATPKPQPAEDVPEVEREACGHVTHTEIPVHGRVGRVERNGLGLTHWEPCPAPSGDGPEPVERLADLVPNWCPSCQLIAGTNRYADSNTGWICCASCSTALLSEDERRAASGGGETPTEPPTVTVDIMADLLRLSGCIDPTDDTFGQWDADGERVVYRPAAVLATYLVKAMHALPPAASSSPPVPDTDHPGPDPARELLAEAVQDLERRILGTAHGHERDRTRRLIARARALLGGTDG